MSDRPSPGTRAAHALHAQAYRLGIDPRTFNGVEVAAVIDRICYDNPYCNDERALVLFGLLEVGCKVSIRIRRRALNGLVKAGYLTSHHRGRSAVWSMEEVLHVAELLHNKDLDVGPSGDVAPLTERGKNKQPDHLRAA